MSAAFSTAIFSPVLRRKGGLFIAFSCLLAATIQCCFWNEMAYLMAEKISRHKGSYKTRFSPTFLCTNSLHNKLQTFKTGIKNMIQIDIFSTRRLDVQKIDYPSTPLPPSRSAAQCRLGQCSKVNGMSLKGRGVLKRSSIQTAFFSQTKTRLTDTALSRLCVRGGIIAMKQSPCSRAHTLASPNPAKNAWLSVQNCATVHRTQALGSEGFSQAH